MVSSRSFASKEKGVDARDIYELMEYKSVYSAYVLSHLEIYNNGTKCESGFEDLPQSDGDYPLSIGARLVFKFKCSEPLNNLKLKNSLFLELFEYESNFVSIYNGDLFLDKVEMNKYYQESEMVLENGSVNLIKPQNFISTDIPIGPDDPSYSEREDPELSSGLVSASGLTTNIKKIWNKLKSTLTGNQDFRDMSALSILSVIFLLGFLHTVEAGHSKVVLTSAMLHRSMTVKRGMIYSVIFTLTHIGDIIIIGLIFLFINNFVDIYSKFNMLEKFAAYALFFMALYMLFRNIAAYREDKLRDGKSSDNKNPIMKPHTHSHGEFEHSHEELFDDRRSYREQIWIGFISGLAPCIFGWSIFMLVISAKKIWLIIPSILSFGFGILIALSLVVFLASALKKPVFNRVAYISEISPIISALILLIYASFLIV